MSKKNNQDILFEIEFYENILKERPYFTEALMALGDHYTRVGRYDDGLRIDEKLYQLKADDPVVLYNLTCSYALTNRIDAAFETLRSAFEKGYNDLGHLQADPDLENLRKDQRFSEFISQLHDKK